MENHEKIIEKDSVDQQYGITYCNLIMNELTNFCKKTNLIAWERALQLILEAELKKRRVHFTGIGKPSYVAKYGASLFSSTGTPAYFLDGTEAVHGSSGQVEPEDIVVAISNSGETLELKRTINVLKNNQAKIIGISGNNQSWLAKNADCFLFAGVKEEGDPLNKPPRMSILFEMIVVQGVSLLLQESKKMTIESYYKWHPGGSLGESIRKKQHMTEKRE